MPQNLSVLDVCTTMWGACEVVHEDPAITEAHNVVALPYLPGGAWGIFNHLGYATTQAMDRHGPDGQLVDRKLIVSPDLLSDVENAEKETYVYGGFVNLHFGHFIVNTIPRLWPIVRNGIGTHQLLFHGQAAPSDWFNIMFIREFFHALGIDRERIRFVDRPLSISRLIIPAPSFQEQHFAHRIFGRLCRRIGSDLLKNSGSFSETNPTPVYLSKGQLTSGVGRFINETMLTDRLKLNGVEIVYPETLTLYDQVNLFSSRKKILGTLGSAFHSSIFCRTDADIVCISPSAAPNSNFVMMDHLSGAKIRYYYDPMTEVVEDSNPNFHTNLKLSDPDAIAQDLLCIL